MKGRWGLASRIGFTYIGTVIGAGFASGQEILQFFTLYGTYGTWGILLSILLFTWLGTRMMLMGHYLRASSYEEFNQYLFGPRWGKWMSGFVGVSLFGVTTAMIAGTGALFEEQMGLSFHLGVLLTALISFFVIARGMEGILSVNTFVVPLMFLFTVLIGVYSWQIGDWDYLMSLAPQYEYGSWILSALTYASFNIALSQAVLVPLGAKVDDPRTIRLGGWLGGLGLGAILLTSNWAMQLKLDEVAMMEIPMALVISALGDWTKYFFLLVMWAEIFTTLVGNVYGLAVNLRVVVPMRLHTIIAFIFTFAYLFSLVGFPTIVSHLYPLFGYCGMVILALLILRKLPKG